MRLSRAEISYGKPRDFPWKLPVKQELCTRWKSFQLCWLPAEESHRKQKQDGLELRRMNQQEEGCPNWQVRWLWQRISNWSLRRGSSVTICMFSWLLSSFLSILTTVVLHQRLHSFASELSSPLDQFFAHLQHNLRNVLAVVAQDGEITAHFFPSLPLTFLSPLRWSLQSPHFIKNMEGWSELSSSLPTKLFLQVFILTLELKYHLCTWCPKSCFFLLITLSAYSLSAALGGGGEPRLLDMLGKHFISEWYPQLHYIYIDFQMD